MYIYPLSLLVILTNSFVAILECLGDILSVIILQILWAPYFKSTFIFPRLDYFYLIFLHSLKFLDIILIFKRGIFMDPWRNHNAAIFQPRRDFPFVLFIHTLKYVTGVPTLWKSLMWTFNRMLTSIDFPFKDRKFLLV